MVACPGHILQSTKEIEIKLAPYIDVKGRKCRRAIILSYILLELSLLIDFMKDGFLCLVLVYKFCLL